MQLVVQPVVKPIASCICSLTLTVSFNLTLTAKHYLQLLTVTVITRKP